MCSRISARLVSTSPLRIAWKMASCSFTPSALVLLGTRLVTRMTSVEVGVSLGVSGKILGRIEVAQRGLDLARKLALACRQPRHHLDLEHAAHVHELDEIGRILGKECLDRGGERTEELLDVVADHLGALAMAAADEALGLEDLQPLAYGARADRKTARQFGLRRQAFAHLQGAGKNVPLDGCDHRGVEFLPVWRAADHHAVKPPSTTTFEPVM
jgi:hypothetical protein